MSDTRDPSTDQQLPVGTDEPHIHDLVSADLQARKEHGIQKYGQPLQASNQRDHLQDAYEEALDMCVYLKAEIERRKTQLDS